MSQNTQVLIRKLQVSDWEAFQRATLHWDNSPGFTWEKPSAEQSFEDFVAKMRRHEQGLDLPQGFVPCTILYAFVGSEIAGRASIRHTLNEFLLNYGGHIGYGVIPAFRRQGIATQLLQASLKICRELKLDRVLLTCDENNVGSNKIIQSCGGKLENIHSFFSNQIPKCRYWIDLSNPV